MAHRALLLSFLTLASCSGAGMPTAGDDDLPAPGGKADGASSGSYRDLEEVLTGDDFERWFDLKRILAREFDEVCGDAFCEGDYTNLQSLRIRCSVSDTTGAAISLEKRMKRQDAKDARAAVRGTRAERGIEAREVPDSRAHT